MPIENVGGVSLFYKMTGESGAPLVLVHGSWADHKTWNFVLPALSRNLRVVTYDRRGYGRSEACSGGRSIRQDAADLAALVEHLNLAPAHFGGSSLGGSVVLQLAADRPELVASLNVHEPPLFRILKDDPNELAAYNLAEEQTSAAVAQLRSGDTEGGTRMFVDTLAFGPGTWDRLPERTRQAFLVNAHNWLAEMDDPQALSMDLDRLRNFPRPALLTWGGQTGTIYPPVVRKLAATLPHASVQEFEKSGHVPHLSHPGEYIQTLNSFVQSAIST